MKKLRKNLEIYITIEIIALCINMNFSVFYVGFIY